MISGVWPEPLGWRGDQVGVEPNPRSWRVLASSVRQVDGQAAWAPLLVLIAHGAASRIWGHEPYVDPAMHFLGGASMAFLFRCAVGPGAPWLGRPSRLAGDLLAFGLACAVALFWEFGEFASDEFLGTRVQISLSNTMRDLLVGVLGAGACLVARSLRRSRTWGAHRRSASE